MHTAGERLDIERPRVFSIDPVANAAQEGEKAHMLRHR
jgi:hypothetical protein